MKKITLFTSTRAEYGLMKKLIANLQADQEFEFNLLVSGTHLSSKFGNTINEIKRDGIKNIHLLPISFDESKKNDMGNIIANTIKLITKKLKVLKPSYLILLGDRFECFGAATAAHLLGIKILHLHGGETTLGALDNKLRHAISQLSTYHFTSAEIHKKKVESIIGSSMNVYNVGPMVMDSLLNLKIISKKEFENETGFTFSKINFLVSFHPETLSPDFGISIFENLVKTLEKFDCNVLFTSPNADIGSKEIRNIIKKFIFKNKDKFFYYPSLGQKLYHNALILFDCLIGNSSSGIIEAPLLKRKVLNFGDRQKGRFRFGDVIDVEDNLSSMYESLINILKNKPEDFDYKEFLHSHKSSPPTKEIINFLKFKI